MFSLIFRRLHTRAKLCSGASSTSPMAHYTHTPHYRLFSFLFRLLLLFFFSDTSEMVLYLVSSVIASLRMSIILAVSLWLSLSLPTTMTMTATTTSTSASFLAILLSAHIFFFFVFSRNLHWCSVDATATTAALHARVYSCGAMRCVSLNVFVQHAIAIGCIFQAHSIFFSLLLLHHFHLH